MKVKGIICSDANRTILVVEAPGVYTNIGELWRNELLVLPIPVVAVLRVDIRKISHNDLGDWTSRASWPVRALGLFANTLYLGVARSLRYHAMPNLIVRRVH